jgi:hypothetical protein
MRRSWPGLALITSKEHGHCRVLDDAASALAPSRQLTPPSPRTPGCGSVAVACLSFLLLAASMAAVRSAIHLSLLFRFPESPLSGATSRSPALSFVHSVVLSILFLLRQWWDTKRLAHGIGYKVAVVRLLSCRAALRCRKLGT